MNFPLLLVALVACTQAAIEEPNWSEFPMVVPATEKLGHRYMITVDYDENSMPVHKAIAVAIQNSEILFTEFDTSANNPKNCAKFYSPRGTEEYCNNQFFLLQEDFMRFARVRPTLVINCDKRKVNDAKCRNYNLTGNCGSKQLAQFQNSIAMLYKKKETDTTVNVGTYFVRKDEFVYFDQNAEALRTIERVIRRIHNQEKNGPHYDQFNVFCRQAYPRK